MKPIVLMLARRKRLTGVAVGLVALLAFGGVALATIPGSGGAISGCYAKKDGSLRVIDATTQCRSGENALTWNQTGPQGPKGDAGAEGRGGTADEGPPVRAGGGGVSAVGE